MPDPKTVRKRIVLGQADGQDVAMTFRQIEKGEFWMGSRENWAAHPVHRVVIEEDFCLGETPVTQQQFAIWSQAVGSDHANHFADRPQNPAENLSWDDAIAFCRWLTKEFGGQFPAGFVCATLPAEAQWEYACRAGTTTEYHSGDGTAALSLAGWYGEGWEKGSTHPVGQKGKNDWGLQDMHGNVWEWCLDRWDEQAYRRRWDGITNAEIAALVEEHGDQDTTELRANRVLRGGSCYSSADNCRSAYRFGFGAGIRDWFDGLRVCLVPSPPEAYRADTAEPERAAVEPRHEAEQANSDGEAVEF